MEQMLYFEFQKSEFSNRISSGFVISLSSLEKILDKR